MLRRILGQEFGPLHSFEGFGLDLGRDIDADINFDFHLDLNQHQHDDGIRTRRARRWNGTRALTCNDGVMPFAA